MWTFVRLLVEMNKQMIIERDLLPKFPLAVRTFESFEVIMSLQVKRVEAFDDLATDVTNRGLFDLRFMVQNMFVEIVATMEFPLAVLVGTWHRLIGVFAIIVVFRYVQFGQHFIVLGWREDELEFDILFFDY